MLLAEAEEEPTGLNWRFVSLRFRAEPIDMPNFSHGLAGIATALALAGIQLDRPDLLDAARRGAEHLVSLGDTGDGGLVVPKLLPRPDSSGLGRGAGDVRLVPWRLRHVAAVPGARAGGRRRRRG